MGAMNTPGVYIVEKNAFPNSVVEVATAVPAFIGHTEKADNRNTPLLNKPWRISSLAEFDQYFGGAPKPVFTVRAATGSEQSDFKALSEAGDPESTQGFMVAQLAGKDGGAYGLYYGMRHFFQNNGGACYVVSVGDYKQEFDVDKFKAGIGELLKEQEPTMLVIPEAVRMEREACKDLQEAMLSHCGYAMKNRFAILDVFDGDKPIQGDGSPIVQFRDGLGINFLDFAAAYYPWLETTVVSEKELSFDNLDQAGRTLLQKLMRIELGIPTDTQALGAAKQQIKDLDAEIEKLSVGTLAKQAVLSAQTQFLAQQAAAVRKSPEAKDKDETALKPLIDAAQAAALAAARQAYVDKAKSAAQKAAQAAGKSAEDATAAGEAAATDAGALWDKDDYMLAAEDLRLAVKSRADLLDKTLIRISTIYKAVMTAARRQLNVLPPSAAMAGIYTMVDNTRGVWKAPANVSVAGVVRPTVAVSSDQQEDLNVNPQGKSINAIRAFIGEGVLVWGARTLDGNSLDWRYVNVRRTMIMLEESCRLAAKALVFEPNVANTWVTIKSMITNFLTSVWKRGGLMGAVPEDAFSVHVGLGETMTPDDILEGILRVTVLVAMVRPAEFIEITFQQQMPKS